MVRIDEYMKQRERDESKEEQPADIHVKGRQTRDKEEIEEQ